MLFTGCGVLAGPGSVVPGAGSAGRYRRRSGRFGRVRPPSRVLVCSATAASCLATLAVWLRARLAFRRLVGADTKRGSCLRYSFKRVYAKLHCEQSRQRTVEFLYLNWVLIS